MDEIRYRFVRDDDGHTYLIEANQVPEFEKWLAAAPYWDGYEGRYFDRYSIGCSPSMYTFTDPKISTTE